eukprot:TRINITY_DN10257_c0_g1_i1.p1 TRINITY_DN10257_c0_g1~~TRINITY_DN10257_c0_g1_i1.p1  ORF type:complete len:575 (+),score=85.47 TRINITY_DN10257_c0_g1_i1:40-1764(+)
MNEDGNGLHSKENGSQDEVDFLKQTSTPQVIEEALSALVKSKPEDVDSFLANYFSQRSKKNGSNGLSVPSSSLLPQKQIENQLQYSIERISDLEAQISELKKNINGTQPKKYRVISARACAVCARDDRPGEVRAKGFKCHECVGLPSNPLFIRMVDKQVQITKGKSEDGEFVFNDYVIKKTLLGEGAFGKVRLCYHLGSPEQLYAVKTLPIAQLKTHRLRRGVTVTRRQSTTINPDSIATARDENLRRCKEEVEIMRRLSHPNIVQIIDSMESETELMIVMEYLEGGQIFPDDGGEPVRVGKLQKYTCAIARGLDYLHTNGVIHRDIKPANILLDKHDNVKLADFGVSAEPNDSFRVFGFIGTPKYMCPEAFNNASTKGLSGSAIDSWAFGVTLFTMAFGKNPGWSGSTLTDLGNSIANYNLEIEHENDHLNDLIGRLLDKNPATRITADKVLKHPFLASVRVLKGHPVETLTLDAEWDDQAKTLKMLKGGCYAEVCDFFASSSSKFQVTLGNNYSMTLYDTKRDPRLTRVAHPEPVDPLEHSSIVAQRERINYEEGWITPDTDSEDDEVIPFA